jgi:putative oxidoreductase
MMFLSRWSPELLSALRIVSGLLFLEHGTAKLLGFPPNPYAFPPVLSLFWFAGVIELVGGVLLTAGLATRLVAFILSGEAAFVYFIGHAPQNFFPLLNNGDAPILWCFVFLYIAAAGPGAWSVDAMIGRERRAPVAAE